MGLIAISSLMLLGGMYLMIAFAWWLLQIIANWRIFTKAGEAGFIWILSGKLSVCSSGLTILIFAVKR